ncbi:MAG: flagellar basal body rod protein FlgC [Zetaproteobacteria bacterium]|nr:MAG: flagellar basal body rod protein FlgC [Zetaproteobacteria bacterium]
MMKGLLASLGISASGMSAQRARMDVIAQNIANAEATRSSEGGPYRRRQVVFAAVPSWEDTWEVFKEDAASPEGVRVVGVVRDPRPFREVFDPGHPDADARGIVRLPNVNVVEEMVDLVSASRSFEANTTAMDAAKRMFLRAIALLR